MAAYTNTVMLADTTDVDGFMGANVNAGFTETMEDLVGVYTETYLCNLVKYDAVTNWGTMNAIYKLMFSEYVARTIAIEAIKYEMNSYTSRVEAEDLINIHLARLAEIKELLENADIQDFIGV